MIAPELWPFRPDWSSPVSVTLEYRTEIFVSRSGKEQRRALRTTPRKTVEFTALIHGDNFRRFERLMAAWLNKPFILADPLRRVSVIARAPDGMAVAVAEPQPWIQTGRVLVFTSATSCAMATVSSVAGPTVRFTAAVPDWVECADLRPGLHGHMEPDMQGRMQTSTVGQIPVVFNVTPGSEPAPVPGTPAATLDGREVLTLAPNWANRMQYDYSFPLETVDYNRGVISHYRPVAFATRAQRAAYLARTPAEAEYLVQVFQRAKGRRGEFYLPSWSNDFPPKVTLAGGTAILRTAGTDVLDRLGDSTIYRALEVRLRDGASLYRQITGMTADQGDTLISVSENWPRNIEPEEIARVSGLLVHRFASDELALQWLTSNVAQTQITFQSLENLEGS